MRAPPAIQAASRQPEGGSGTGGPISLGRVTSAPAGSTESTVMPGGSMPSCTGSGRLGPW